MNLINRGLNRVGIRLKRATCVLSGEGVENMNHELPKQTATAAVNTVQVEANPHTISSDAGTLVPLLAHEELVRVRKEMPEIFERAAKKVATGELGLIGWGLTLPRVQKLAPEHETKPWFFMGDIHGDFLAWHRLFSRVQQVKDFRLCFLGDLIDRGPYDIECFAAMLAAIERYPNQIMWVMGNHDDGIRWNYTDQKFRVAGELAEGEADFVRWLNDPAGGLDKESVSTWGRLFVDVVRRLPRAALFSDGLLATHGGVPLADRWEFLKTMESFHHERCLADFTWTRIVNFAYSKEGWKYAPKVRKVSSSFEIGAKNLEGFCDAVSAVFPVKRVVRGHDPVENGFEHPECYRQVPVLTLNGFGLDYMNSFSSRNYRKTLVLGVGQIGELPNVEAVSFLPEEYAGVYPLVLPVSEFNSAMPSKPTESVIDPVAIKPEVNVMNDKVTVTSGKVGIDS